MLMLGDKDILKHSHALPQPYILECTRYPQSRYLIRGGCKRRFLGEFIGIPALICLGSLAGRMVPHHRLAHEFDKPVGRLIYAGNTVKCRCLTCPIRTYKGNYLILWDIQGKVIDGYDAPKLHRYVFKM